MSDAELLRFASEFRCGVLNGDPSRFMCIAVCAPLSALLGLHGVDTDIGEWKTEEENHVWLTLPDGRVLDPTADQYGAEFPAVYLGPPLRIHFAPLNRSECPRAPQAIREVGVLLTSDPIPGGTNS